MSAISQQMEISYLKLEFRPYISSSLSTVSNAVLTRWCGSLSNTPTLCHNGRRSNASFRMLDPTPNCPAYVEVTIGITGVEILPIYCTPVG